MSPRTWLSVLGVSALVIVLGFVAPGWTQGKTKGKKYALVVGVTEYASNSFKPLRYTVNDAEALAKELLTPTSGFTSVRVLTNKRGVNNSKDMPTAENIRSALKELVANKKKGDTVLVALAGHGMQLTVKDPDEKGEAKQFTFFCPHDASLLGISYKTGNSTKLIPLDEVFETLGKTDATHKLALIDACRNEDTVKASERARLDASKVTIPDGVAAMFSCSRRQFAWETADLGGGHGVFFYYVLQGLKGEAKNRRGVVTWDSLADYVKAEVAEAVPKLIGGGATQSPALMGNLEGEAPVLATLDKVVAEGSKDKAGKEEVVKDKDTFTNSVGMKFVRVKAGKFTMGSPTSEVDRADNEKEHEVAISKDYFLGVTEVTQKQWLAVVGGKNPSYFCADGRGKGEVKDTNTDDFPVEQVSWKDTVTFLEKLNDRAAKNYKVKYVLPTEAQWEYACRGGHLIKTLEDKARLPFHFKTPSASLSVGQANFHAQYPYGKGEKGAYLARTNTVGKNGEANALGLFDMHGNVWEWCSDWYAKDYYGTPGSLKDPKGPATPPKDRSYRVRRGGGWYAHGHRCRAALRDGADPERRDSAYMGFRLAAVPHE